MDEAEINDLKYRIAILEDKFDKLDRRVNALEAIEMEGL